MRGGGKATRAVIVRSAENRRNEEDRARVHPEVELQAAVVTSETTDDEVGETQAPVQPIFNEGNEEDASVGGNPAGEDKASSKFDEMSDEEADKARRALGAKFKHAGKAIIQHTVRTSAQQRKLREAREAETKRNRADFFVYCLFMLVFTLNTIDGLGDSSAFRMFSRVSSTLNQKTFELISDVPTLNNWIQNVLVPSVFSDNFEASGSLNGPGDPDDDTKAASGWIIQGPVRIAQLRSSRFDCSDDMPGPVSKKYSFRCTHSRQMSYFDRDFDEDHEDTSDFRGFSFRGDLPGTPEGVGVMHQRNEVSYTSYETPSRHTYPSPAFAVYIDPHQSRSDAQATADRLVSNRYVDRQTNVVFIDLSLYNYFLLSTVWVRYTAEFDASGGVTCSFEAVPVQLYWKPSTYQYKLTFSILVGLGYGYFALLLAFKFYKEGISATLEKPITWTQLLNIFFYVIQRVYQYEAANIVSSEVDFLSAVFTDYRPVVRAMRLAITFESLNTFLNWFKLVGYLARYPVFALMTQTLVHSIDELSAFGVVFFVVMYGFAQAHAMYFGQVLKNYSTVGDSFYTLFRAMLGDFNFNETYQVNYIIGPLFFCLFVGIAFLVVLNIIIAIIADAYVEANEARKVEIRRKRRLEEAAIKDDEDHGVYRARGIRGQAMALGSAGIGAALDVGLTAGKMTVDAGSLALDTSLTAGKITVGAGKFAVGSSLAMGKMAVGTSVSAGMTVSAGIMAVS